MNFLKPQNLLGTVGAALGLAALGLCAVQPVAAASVLVNINPPGAYGRLLIREPIPQEAWVYQQPTMISPQQYNLQRQPIYLYVPAAQSSNWGRYCNRYSACGQPVIFVKDGWIRERHAQYQQQHRRGNDRDHDGIKNSRDHDRDGDGVRNSRDRFPNNPNRN